MTGLGSVGICFHCDTCGIPEYQVGSEAASILILAVKEERRIPSLFLRLFSLEEEEACLMDPVATVTGDVYRQDKGMIM